MKNFKFKIISAIFLSLSLFQLGVCSELSAASELLQKAELTSNQDESYEYINKARLIYEEMYNENPSDISALLGLSKTFQLIGDRQQAKLFVLKAYNTNPANPDFQKAMGDFYFSFQEYSTAVEYYKLALASGLLRNYETNLQTAKCFEKLGDTENAELYYKISYHLNSKSKEAMKKINEYESKKHPDDSAELEKAKYKYLLKDKIPSKKEQTENDAQDIIQRLIE